jgi:hypothetical protein
VVEALGPVMAVNPGVTYSVQAVCPAGKVPFAGGHESGGSAPSMNLVTSAPFFNGSSGWRVVLRNNGATMLANVQVRAWVLCGTVLP